MPSPVAPPSPVRASQASRFSVIALGLMAFAITLLFLASELRSLRERGPETPPASLALTPAGDSPSFLPENAPPDLPFRDALPALGTWRQNDTTTTGTWTSAPLTTSTSLLQFRVTGTLRPPATSLILRTLDGREIGPLENNFTSNDRWKRINFPAPDGPFQIVARDNSADSWLAFTAPVEISRWSWFVRKLIRTRTTESVMFALAAALFIAALLLLRHPRAASTAAQVWRIVPWAALLAYAIFFAHHIDPIAGPNDSGGYLNAAKSLASGHLGPATRPIWGPAAGETDQTPYLATTFHPHDGVRTAPEYPLGLPLIFAAAGRILTLDHAIPAVILLQLVLGVVFTRQLARSLGLSDGWDWLAAGIVGLSPVYLFQALQPQSDGPALVWCTAAVYWAWVSRTRPWLALLSGLATALAVLIRPSNVLIAFPILIVLAGSWRQLALWIVAGLPAALWLGWVNQTLYGGILQTGYGNMMSTGFGLRFLPLTLRSYLAWLPLLFTPLILLAPAALFLRRIEIRIRMMLAVWTGVFIAFYAVYWCTWDNWYNMRFLLPAAPAMVVLALIVTRALAERAGLSLFQAGSFGRSFAPALALVVLLAALLIYDACRRDILLIVHNNGLNATGPRWLARNVPPDAVVFAKHATNSLLYYTDLTFVRSDHPKAQSIEFFESIARTGRPIYALNYGWEGHGRDNSPERGQGRPTLPGHWTRIMTFWGNELHVWQWSPPKPAQQSNLIDIK